MNRNKIFKCIILFGLFSCLYEHSMAQRLREIIVLKNTTKEVNKNPAVIEEIYIEDGIRITMVDSLNKILTIASYKDNELDGQYWGFFVDATDMLEEKGQFKNNQKQGKWYYWNKEGVLLRTEIWKNNKLITRKIMSKVK